MRVKRDFDEIYRAERDPWAIGAADDPRYAHYRDLILEFAERRGSLLDIGCGLGAFAASMRHHFAEVSGVDVSAEAVERAAGRTPSVRFLQCSADRLDASPLDGRRFDVVVLSDVLYYLDERGRRRCLSWIDGHLDDRGIALVAGWSPGGRYLTPDEVRHLLAGRFAVLHDEVLETEHSVFVVRRRQRYFAVTVDYETWHPVPAGRRIDWETDVFTPAEALMSCAERHGISLTFMAEMGEYLWLREHDDPIAERMGRQWQSAVQRGHDVQLHLHPNWLPELGAKREEESWWWDWSVVRLEDYPGDLTALLVRCKAELERLLKPVRPDYEAVCFRAGAYAAQPFSRLWQALGDSGVMCDSSVFRGGLSTERGYDYRNAFSSHQPYFASRHDPQLKAPPGEERVVELPIATFAPGERWMLDGDLARGFARRLTRHLDASLRQPSTESYRLARRLKGLLQRGLALAKPVQPWLFRLLPTRLAAMSTGYGPERLVHDDFFVAIGHTKGDPRVAEIDDEFRALSSDPRLQSVTLGTMARLARAQLLARPRRDRAQEASYQVAREYDAILGEERNAAQSYYLQDLIPHDADRVLDLGCGAGYWSSRIAGSRPWQSVIGLDHGAEFVSHASREHGARAFFLRGDFGDLPFPDGAFDVVYADNVLEHAFDVDETIIEISRVLRAGGTLVAAIPTDGRRPEYDCDNHTWKTIPADVEYRLAAAGFGDVRIEEVNTRRRFGQPPYPPSDDRMMYVRASKRSAPPTSSERIREAMAWVYRRLEPGQPASEEPAALLEGGVALCAGYAVALRHVLEAEGMVTRHITIFLRPHPKGRGPDAVDTHSLLEVRTGGRWHVADPMSNVLFDGYSIDDLVAHPEVVDPIVAAHPLDERFKSRRYDLYCSTWAYERCVRVLREPSRTVMMRFAQRRVAGRRSRHGLPRTSGPS